MRIGIEGQRLFRKKKHGMDFVALELVRNLQLLDKENEYEIFVKPGPDKCLESTPNVHITELDGGPYPLWEQVGLPKAAKKHGCDLLHCTSNTGPVSGSVPLIITLHDIFYLETISLLKKGFTTYQKFGNMYRRFIVPLVVRRSKKIVTVSQSEKKRIAGFFRNLDDRLTVVYNGVGTRFIPIDDQALLLKIKQTYHLPEKFIFLLGNTDPKKNTKGALLAYSRYLEISENPMSLVIADFPEQHLEEVLTGYGIKEVRSNIIRLDYIDNKDLPAVFSLSSQFIYPSFWESFGIPILEAMSCGTPVITSNVFAMPEIAGDAALLIDPKNPDEMAQAMCTLSENPNRVSEMKKKGLEQAKRFSWKKMASEYLELYKEIHQPQTRRPLY